MTTATSSGNATSSATTTIVSAKPVTLAGPDRGQDLRVNVTAPARGQRLPVIVFSHGMTLAMADYAPLVEYWAAAGFVIVQPTHLDSLGLPPDDPRTPDIWRIRVRDLSAILDQFDALEAAAPGLTGRIDRDRVVAAGHSWGAQTASMLAGARVIGADGEPGPSMADARVTAALLLCLPGTGGDDLSPLGAQYFPFMSPDFGELTTPSLVVAGDADQSPLSVRGPDWFTDGYRLSPGATDLLLLFGAEHGLGGVHGSFDTRTTDESPERVAFVQRATLAYLRTALGLDPEAWPALRTSVAAQNSALGRIESK